MGRTYRRRQQKRKPRDYQTCENNVEISSLNSWLVKNGLRRNPKLALSIFNTTGRGLLTKKRIYPDEELLQLPLCLTINIITLLQDSEFNTIFFNSSVNIFQLYGGSTTFQCLLAFYLVFHKYQECKSTWYIYLKNLPTNYTVPYFLHEDILHHLDTSIFSIVDKQKLKIKSSFNIFMDILSKCSSSSINVLNLRTNFSLLDYEWAYFTVNTRCVYINLSKVVDLENCDKNILSLICDNTNIALCPYLDMINHSPNAKNETKLLLCKQECTQLNYDAYSKIKFSLYTKMVFEPYTEVFICYGDSYNLKLLTEYGFIIPCNNLDYVAFDYQSLISYFNSTLNRVSQDQITFIINHGLHKDLYIDIKGLSFNFYAFLTVIKFYYEEDIDISKVIYSSMHSNNAVADLITTFLQHKIVKTNNSIYELKKHNMNCIILNNCVELMCQYVKILDKFVISCQK